MSKLVIFEGADGTEYMEKFEKSLLETGGGKKMKHFGSVTW